MARKLAVGSNQYRTRTGDDLIPIVGPDLMERVGIPQRLRCGEVWGTGCRAWVLEPGFTHGNHIPDTKTQISVARRPSTPPPVLASLADGATFLVQLALEQNPQCPPSILARLGSPSNAVQVLEAVARNHNCPAAILRTLVDAPWASVRYEAARNPGLPLDKLMRIIGDPDGDLIYVYQAALDNPSLPDEYRILVQITSE